MADNTELSSGSGGDTIATDDIGGVKYPRSKIVIGADGSNDGDVSSANPLPVLATGAASENAAAAGNPILVGARYDATPRTLGDGDVGAIAVDADGAVHISDGGNTITVDGTVTANLSATDNAVLDAIAAALAGSLTVDAANDGSLNVTIGDGSNTATIRNLAANDALNVSIVDGAGNQVTSFGGSGGTSATDDSAFTAGSGSGTPAMGFFSSDTVDAGDCGVLAMDASRRLLVSIEADNAGIGGGTQYTEDAAAPANPVGNAMMAERDDALAGLTPTEGDWSHLYVNANGALWVKQDGDVTVSGTVTANLGATDNAVLDSIDTNTSNADTSLGTIAGAISGSEMQVDVVGALPAGTNNIGDVDVASIAAGSNLIGDVGIQGRTTGGLSIFRSIDLDESEEEVKGSAGTVYSIVAFNTTAAPLYLKFYNATAASTTVGTTTPVLTLLIPGNADSDGAGFAFSVPQGIAFGTAITAAVTTGIADSDTGAPGANAALTQVFYK